MHEIVELSDRYAGLSRTPVDAALVGCQEASEIGELGLLHGGAPDIGQRLGNIHRNFGQSGLPPVKEFSRQGFQADFTGLLEQIGPFYEILQLPNVARPGVVDQSRNDPGLQALNAFFIKGVEPGQEIVGQDWDVFFAFPQGRQKDREDIQSVEQVSSKDPLITELLEVMVGGGNDPDIRLDLLLSSHPLKGALLKNLQEFGLAGQADGPYLIKKEGSVSGHLEFPQVSLVGSGEGTPLVAEEFTLQEALRNGPAIKVHKRPGSALAQFVEKPACHSFAGPGLPQKQDCRPSIGHGFNFCIDRAHGRSLQLR